MMRQFLDWVVYGDRSQEPPEKIEFLKGLVPSDPKLRLESEARKWGRGLKILNRK